MKEGKKVTVKIEESPYGDKGAVYEGMLGMFHHYVLQLKSFRPQNKTPEEREGLEADIRGYEAVLASGKEENARKFMEVKHENIRAGKSFRDNEAIVAHMKETGVWK